MLITLEKMTKPTLQRLTSTSPLRQTVNKWRKFKTIGILKRDWLTKIFLRTRCAPTVISKQLHPFLTLASVNLHVFNIGRAPKTSLFHIVDIKPESWNQLSDDGTYTSRQEFCLSYSLHCWLRVVSAADELWAPFLPLYFHSRHTALLRCITHCLKRHMW